MKTLHDDISIDATPQARFAPLDKVAALESQGQVTILRASRQPANELGGTRPVPLSCGDDQLNFL